MQSEEAAGERAFRPARQFVRGGKRIIATVQELSLFYQPAALARAFNAVCRRMRGGVENAAGPYGHVHARAHVHDGVRQVENLSRRAAEMSQNPPHTSRCRRPSSKDSQWRATLQNIQNRRCRVPASIITIPVRCPVGVVWRVQV